MGLRLCWPRATGFAPPMGRLLGTVDLVTPVCQREFGSVGAAIDLLGIQSCIVSVDGGRHRLGRGGQAVRVGFVAEDGLVASDSLHCVWFEYVVRNGNLT